MLFLRMNELLAAIQWDVDPILFTFGPLTIRWYGLLFALGFLFGQSIFFYIFKKEGRPEQDVETLTIYMVLATIIGARLGHCLFYQPEIYLADPLKIFAIWEGGLASHGGAAGILIAIYIYTHFKVTYDTFLFFFPYNFKVKKEKREGQSYLWVLDRIVIVVALGGAFIRFGNLMNSEIVGLPTDLPWAFVFERLGDGVPRHPAQLYESITCLILFFLLLAMWNRKKQDTPKGQLFGIFLIWIFGLRFFYEFLKENQVRFEDELFLNMGQILSIPLVIAGIIVLINTHRRKQKLQSQKTA